MLTSSWLYTNQRSQTKTYSTDHEVPELPHIIMLGHLRRLHTSCVGQSVARQAQLAPGGPKKIFLLLWFFIDQQPCARLTRHRDI